MAQFSAASTFDCVFSVSRLPLQARDTILWVISTDEIATRSCGLRLCSRMIWAIGCSPRFRSISGLIVVARRIARPSRLAQSRADRASSIFSSGAAAVSLRALREADERRMEWGSRFAVLIEMGVRFQPPRNAGIALGMSQPQYANRGC
jgi:hypothetical protein